MNRKVVLVLGFALVVASRSQAQPSAECRALQGSPGTDSSTGFTGVSLNRYDRQVSSAMVSCNGVCRRRNLHRWTSFRNG